MTQTGKIAFAIFVGFVVYVTLLGHLASYFKLLWSGGSNVFGGGNGKANPGGATTPGFENIPGGGASIFGPQNAGGGYTPDPLSPNVLINDNFPNQAWGGVSMNELIRQAQGNIAGGAAL